MPPPSVEDGSTSVPLVPLPSSDYFPPHRETARQLGTIPRSETREAHARLVLAPLRLAARNVRTRTRRELARRGERHQTVTGCPQTGTQARVRLANTRAVISDGSCSRKRRSLDIASTHMPGIRSLPRDGAHNRGSGQLAPSSDAPAVEDQEPDA